MIKRTFEITSVLLKYLVFYNFNQHKNKIFGKRLRESFENLGLTFIKIGQVLSMRIDIFSQKNCKELQKLLDNVNPLDYEIIREIIVKDFRKTPEKLFRKFNKNPIASASISQVHKGILKDGTVVAIKIKRPEVDEKIKKDIRISKIIFFIAKIFSSTLRCIKISELIVHFEKWLENETDFKKEEKNLLKARIQYNFVHQKKFRKDLGKGFFPISYPKFCSENIITMDFAEGVPLTKIDSIKNNPNYDIFKSFKTYLSAGTRNMFNCEEYLFQADPHLSNILILPNGDFSNIDYGLTEELNKKDTFFVKNIFLAIYTKNSQDLIKFALELSNVEHKQYAYIIEEDVKIFLEKTKNEGIGFWFMGIIKILIKYKIPIPTSISSFARCCVILDGLTQTIFPGKTTVDIMGDELKMAAVKQIIDNIKNIDIFPVIYTFANKIKEIPEFIDDIVNNPLETLKEIKNLIKDC